MRSTKKLAVRLLAVLILSAMMLSTVSCELFKGKHEHSYTTEVVAPTCTEKGYTKHTCSCGDSYTDNETPAGHQMLEVVEKQPTCTEDGEAAFHVCQLCGYVEGNKTVIPALGHLYDTTYEYPTATENGSKTSVCRNCKDTKTETIEALGVTLPEASKILAQIIGSFEATLELANGSGLAYVTEYNNPESETLGYKQFLVFEVAEAELDSNGEILSARLKIKVYLSEEALTGLVDSKDVAFDKANAECLEINFYVLGDDISVSMNGQNMGANMSELVYGTLAQMLGIGDYETLKQILDNGRLFVELANLRDLLTQGVIDSLVGELGSIDPAYIEHLAELFAVFGEEIMTVTTDEEGNTTCTLNVAALKKLVAELEGKTIAEYLESVYGKNVVASMADFLVALPDKTVKDIVNAAVTLAENTGLAIGDIYTLIDLYVYTATGMEFSIESQIADRYNMTLVDVIAEFSGITGADKLVFVTNVKSSFAQISEMMQVISIEDFLPFENLYALIDMLSEQIVYTFTMDAEGNLVEMYYAFAGIEYSVEVDSNRTIITVILPNGFRMSEIIKTDGSIYSYEVSIRDAENDLVHYRVVVENDVVTHCTATIAGYVTGPTYGYYDPETDEYYETEPEVEFVTFIVLAYDDAEGTKTLNINAQGTGILLTEKDGDLTVVITDEGEVIANGTLTFDETVEGETVTETINMALTDGKNDLLVFNSVTVNGVVTDVYAAVKGYFLHTEHNHEIAQPEYEYETKPMPEGEFVTGTSSEGGEIIIVVPGYTCENCVTVEEYVTWLEVTYTTLEDGTKTLNVLAHDDLNETTEGIDQLIVTIDGDQIIGVLYKDEAPIASIGFAFTENTLIGEVKDLENGANTTMALLEIVLSETLDAILSASLVVYDYEYYYYEGQEPAKELVEIFNGSYEWIDNEEGADNIVIGYNGATYTLGYEITEEGVKLSLTDDAEEVVVEFAVTQNDNTVRVDALLEVWGMTYVDGAITVITYEDALTLWLDIDRLVINEGYWSTDYIECRGVLEFKLG